MLKYNLETYLLFLITSLSNIKGKKEEFFISDSTDFSKVAQSPVFVDKTRFIKEFITNNKTSFITAPPKYGKSTNLDMLKRFLEVEVDNDGVKKTQDDYSTEPVKDTDNYKLFYDNKLNISHEEALMNEFFGRSPVLSVSFKCDKAVKDSADLLIYFRQVVHNAFRKYIYLTKSFALVYEQQQHIEKWCDENEYQKFNQHQVCSALKELSKYLYEHFTQRKVYVLVDDNDHVVKRVVLSNVDNSILRIALEFSANMLNMLLKRNMFVQRGLITGVLDIPAIGVPPHNTKDPESFQVYRFLGLHQFVDFYGLTREEVENLMEAHNIKHTIDEVATKYNGYLSKPKWYKMYNLYSVINFVKSGKLLNYWTDCNPIPYIEKLLEIPIVQNNFSEILIRNESVHLTDIDKLTADDFVHFKNVIGNSNVNVTDVSTIFFFLFTEGYLTYKTGIVILIDKETPKIGIRCPNDEIKDYFGKALNICLADC